ncbi:MAG: D-glycero-beta-D-manno-heptose 1-phosphate adenylyltransferase [Acidobacteria bacterium]|nr:D-glycero-beta-D-manno-heptose 1-phosphate adenylyltransferase [Acidobacteriota bacterium]
MRLAPVDPESKIMSLVRMQERTNEWKAVQERVVFTNGCFDILHVGHVTLLDTARREGNRLIVGINSDDSVRRLKGPSRPVVDERSRARVLAALEAVDAVVVFDEPTPLELMLALRPDVIVKGGDYQADSIVGAAEVRSWGGRVKIVSFVPGFSTTEIIARAAVPEEG